MALPPRSPLTSLLLRGPKTASEVGAALGVSSRTALRMLAAVGKRVCVIGAARRRRYALLREFRGEIGGTPVFTVDERGRSHSAGQLNLLMPSGSQWESAPSEYPLGDFAGDGVWPGLPYPIYHMAPQGFIGRSFARREYRALEVSPDPKLWSDDQIVFVLSRRGSDSAGNLIVGAEALELYQESVVNPPEPLSLKQVPAAYKRLAEAAVAAGVPGSSAAGEFPKFTALREKTGARTPHVIVKFSGVVTDPASARWSDLLIAEHLASEVIKDRFAAVNPPLDAPTTRIVIHAGRTFFETERVDRHSLSGRSALVSLAAIDGALIGSSGGDWRASARAMVGAKLLAPNGIDAICVAWWFGHLIANTDMHLGNLSFYLKSGSFELAPLYDMLPMSYAPLAGGELPLLDEPKFSLPLPDERPYWNQALEAAVMFWSIVSGDVRISAPFRDLAAKTKSRLRALAEIA